LFDALLRHVQGKITLHGSAVCGASRAVALVGPGNAGKSTIAAALCGYDGIELLADDTVALELDAHGGGDPVRVGPTQTANWLLPDARAELGLDASAPTKLPIGFRSAGGPVPLDAVIGLVFDENVSSVELRRVRGQDAFGVLSGCNIRFVIDEPAAQVREFDQLKLVMENCRVFELRRPRDIGQLRRSAEIVREVLMNPSRETTP
jgi:hypothetical protein